ncbi:hypothetical protein KIW84_060515 [Lathyrus oleraceus]|uniref:Uncharacterized protein n=1 Tax=Pisum sativum TaxID=3888 RepID=A0A9D5A2Y0_PEA|nr:hypothetical protein KIW84_060515 [Pisum sativum]
MTLKKDLERKQELLEGLLFDFRLLQELASNSKEIKDQTEQLIISLSQARYELEIKSSQLDNILIQNRKLEASLADTEKVLTRSNYDLELAKESIEKFADQNEELRNLSKELYANKTETEVQIFTAVKDKSSLEASSLSGACSLLSECCVSSPLSHASSTSSRICRHT